MKEYCFEDIIKVVKREKNKKRAFLFLNLLQGKYVPSNPIETLQLFETLGKRVSEKYKEERICIIGFAETATAIAAAAASCFQQAVYFLHTTREELSNEYFITEFEEEHSHAKQHRLYCRDKDVLQSSDVLMLIDDEFTTGKTVCNFIKKLREEHWIRAKCKVVAASLINCMKKEDMQRFAEEMIECEYLLRKDYDWKNIGWGKEIGMEKVCQIQSERQLKQAKERKSFNVIMLSGKVNPRLGIYYTEYRKACENLTQKMIEQLQIEKEKAEDIVLLGTEEYMYPVIYAAAKIQETYPNKRCSVHATSRSPIVPMKKKDYPIYERDSIMSFYEEEREVFLYNLKKYDQVIMLTDAENITGEAKCSIEMAMDKYKNYNFKLIQWI